MTEQMVVIVKIQNQCIYTEPKKRLGIIQITVPFTLKRKGKQMELNLKINCDHAAFGDLECELQRIFDQIARRYAGACPGDELPVRDGESRNILDSNGNVVGYWEMVDH